MAPGASEGVLEFMCAKRRQEKADAACVGESSGGGGCVTGSLFERGVRGAGGQPDTERAG